MTTVTLDTVLAQARQLTPADQARLITALIPTANTQQVVWLDLDGEDENEDDVDEQRETWTYLQRVLDEDRLSARPLFPQGTE
ncbi:MAG: hypothetical protein MI924_38630 [Chloroflexales bacterium]|nr:hypothetical protein [Chloroflexales bacterium]